MAESESKWAQNADKIAYGVAGLLGVIALALPFVMGGGISASSLRVQNSLDGLKRKITTQTNPRVRSARTPEALSRQWVVGQPAENPAWSHQVAPVLLREIDRQAEAPCIHAAPVMLELRCQRDPEARRVTILVSGSVGEGSEHVILESLDLFRAEKDGAFLKIHSIQDPKGPFQYVDDQVVPGLKYSYRIVSYARRDPSAPGNISALAEPRQQSENLGPTPLVPHDLGVRIIAFVKAKVEDPGSRNGVMAQIQWWDYEKGEVQERKKRGAIFEDEKFAGGVYKFFPIDPGIGEAGVREVASNRPILLVQRGKKPDPVALWEPVVPETVDTSGLEQDGEESNGDTEDNGAAEASAETKSAAPATKPRRGRRRTF